MIAINFRNFRERLNDSVCVVFVTRARSLDRCNSREMQAVFKKMKTELLQNGTISGIINTLLYNTCGYFALCSYVLRGSEKYYATPKISARIIC